MDITRVDADGLPFDDARVASFSDLETNETCLLFYTRPDGTLSDGPPDATIAASRYVVAPLLIVRYQIYDAQGDVMRTVTFSAPMPQHVVHTFAIHRDLVAYAPRHERGFKRMALIMRMNMMTSTPIVQAVLQELKLAAEADRKRCMVEHDMRNGGYVLVG